MPFSAAQCKEPGASEVNRVKSTTENDTQLHGVMMANVRDVNNGMDAIKRQAHQFEGAVQFIFFLRGQINGLMIFEAFCRVVTENIEGLASH
ncbi:hypothetical protein EMIT0P265_70337 [Pseudomonas zeae]